MVEHKKEPLTAECEEWFFLSLREVTSSFGVSTEIVTEIINEGIITVKKDEKDEWLFDNEAIRRIRTVLQLNRDLGVNLAGAGLALELMTEIERLRALLTRNLSDS
ncbi:chaperone modulator CbpM [Legionella fairfieldensis]|uniref:chaperone modulator CbpM n=1 Tax=Legionella fairfieldensis TaxID=45064 RepID=UPI00048D46E9|nr:chaperone modulator CbpM [Legionella fairfieldensis]